MATRALLLTSLALVACGGGGAPAGPSRPAGLSPSESADGGSGASAPDVTLSIDALAARGPIDAPLMRELLRVPNVLSKSPEIRAERDQCIRVLASANAAVKLWLVDGAGAPRGDAAAVTAAPVARVPASGPACAKKGESLRLVVEGGAATTLVRAVVFALP